LSPRKDLNQTNLNANCSLLDYLLLSAVRFLPSAFRLLPSAFRLLPSAFRFLPSAFCLPPSAFRLLILHAHNVVPAIDVQDFAGYASRHV
jgi:hypothetical protein